MERSEATTREAVGRTLGAYARVTYGKGDKVISPDSPGIPWRPLRVTEAHVSASGQCMVRIAALGGTWMHAEAFLAVPDGAEWSQLRGRWMRGEVDVTPTRTDLARQVPGINE